MNFYVLAKPDADEPDNPHGPTDALWEEGFTSGEALRAQHAIAFSAC